MRHLGDPALDTLAGLLQRMLAPSGERAVAQLDKECRFGRKPLHGLR